MSSLTWVVFRDNKIGTIQRSTVHCMHHLYDDIISVKTFHDMIYIALYLHIKLVHVQIIQWSDHSVAGTLCHFINLAEAVWMLLINTFNNKIKRISVKKFLLQSSTHSCFTVQKVHEQQGWSTIYQRVWSPTP